MRSKPLVLNSKWLVAGRIWGRCGTGIDQSRMFFDQLLLFLSQWLRCCLLTSCASFLTDCFLIPRGVCRPNQQKPKYANSSDFYWFSNGFKPFQKKRGPCACFCYGLLLFLRVQLCIFRWWVELLFLQIAHLFLTSCPFIFWSCEWSKHKGNRHTAGKQCGH